MSKDLKKQLENRIKNLSWLTVTRAKGNESVADEIGKIAKEIAEITEEMSEGDEPAPLPKSLKQAHYGGLGILLWFMHGSWKDKDLVEWTGHLNRTVERIRREGFSAVDFLCGYAMAEGRIGMRIEKHHMKL